MKPTAPEWREWMAETIADSMGFAWSSLPNTGEPGEWSKSAFREAADALFSAPDSPIAALVKAAQDARVEFPDFFQCAQSLDAALEPFITEERG